jgi:hypothetical protein
MGPLVLDAPFEADAITTARLTLQDGTRLNQSTTARYYRDRAGHVRVELLMEGLRWTFTLDPVTRTARYASRGSRRS